MRSVGAYEAKTHLLRLRDEVAAGKSVVTMSAASSRRDAFVAAFEHLHRVPVDIDEVDGSMGGA